MKYLAKIIEYGLYLLVFSLPIQTRWIIRQGLLNNGPWEYGSLSLYATDILLTILLLFFLIYKVSQRKFLASNRSADGQLSLNFRDLSFKSQLTWLFIAGLVLTSAVSIFFAPDKILSLYKFGWLMLGIGLFWLLVSASYNKTKLIWFLIAGIASQAGLAIWQFLFQATFQNKWLGLALHRSGELGTSVIETIGQDGIGERWLRAYGGMDHPNILGGLLAVGILFLAGEIIKNHKRQNTIKAILWSLLVVLTAALFFSFSRSAWLGLGASLVALILWSAIKKNLMAQKMIAQVILICGAIIFILFLMYPNLVLTRFYLAGSFTGTPSVFKLVSAPGRLEIKSSSERIESIKNSWPIIKNHWAGGVGIGGYGLADYEVKIKECGNAKKACEKISSFIPTPNLVGGFIFQPVHNVYLLVWSEIGIFGLLFFLCLIIYILISHFKKRLSSPLDLADAVTANKIVASANYQESVLNISILIVMLIIMCFDHWLWSLHFGVLFFWLVLGLASRNSLALRIRQLAEQGDNLELLG